MAINYFQNGAKKAEQYQITADDTFMNRTADGDVSFTDSKNGVTLLSELKATASTQIVTDENLSSQLDGSTTVLTVANSVAYPISANLNGGLLIKDVHYTSSTTVFTFIGKYAVAGDIPASGEELYFTYFQTV